MKALMNQPEAYQIDVRFQDLNKFYTRDVIMWVLTANYDQLLCDTERDAHRHAMNILETFDANEVMDSYTRLYPEMIEFFNLRKQA